MRTTQLLENLEFHESAPYAQPLYVGVHDLRAECISPETVRTDLHIAIRADTPVTKAERIAGTVMERLH